MLDDGVIIDANTLTAFPSLSGHPTRPPGLHLTLPAAYISNEGAYAQSSDFQRTAEQKRHVFIVRWIQPCRTGHCVSQSDTTTSNSILLGAQALYEVSENNETGTIKFFINNWTKNQHYPLQSSSLWKPHTARDIPPIPGSSTGSHVEMPSAGLSRPFGCPHFQNDDFWGGICVFGKGRSHMDSHKASMGVAEPLNILFGQKFVHRDGSVTGSIVTMQHPSVRSLWLSRSGNSW